MRLEAGHNRERLRMDEGNVRNQLRLASRLPTSSGCSRGSLLQRRVLLHLGVPQQQVVQLGLRHARRTTTIPGNSGRVVQLLLVLLLLGCELLLLLLLLIQQQLVLLLLLLLLDLQLQLLQLLCPHQLRTLQV